MLAVGGADGETETVKQIAAQDDRAYPDPAAADQYTRCGRSRTVPVKGENST